MTRLRAFKRIATMLSMLLILAASAVSYAAPTEDIRAALPPGGSDGKATMEQTNEILLRMIKKSFAMALEPFEEELSHVDLTIYDNVASQRDVFFRMANLVSRSLFDSYASFIRLACDTLRSMNTSLISIDRGVRALSWQQAAALYMAYGEEMNDRLAEGLLLGLNATANGAAFSCAFADNERMFSQGTREQLITAKFALYYLNTVYDELGRHKEYATPALPQAYLDTLTHPLPGCLIKNGWYGPRSNRTRLHTGTDIRAARNTEILSVTDGVVLYIGFSRIPGNYVIIRDPSGYEYHYYHMVSLSTHVKEGETVRQGQTVGLVGSTGNSAANHLHLAIVTPENAYINPYDVFMQAGFTPIRPSV